MSGKRGVVGGKGATWGWGSGGKGRGMQGSKGTASGGKGSETPEKGCAEVSGGKGGTEGHRLKPGLLRVTGAKEGEKGNGLQVAVPKVSKRLRQKSIECFTKCPGHLHLRHHRAACACVIAQVPS